ncbi:hypothetical protein BH23GEM8_BH23GEM8_07890 [soil metagenome]
MGNHGVARRHRTEEAACAFLVEARRDLERAAAQGGDVPPRIRIIHERPGHATAEYRTLAVPIPPGAEGASPAVLSRVIASYAASKEPHALLLALDVLGQDEEGKPRSLLICEARDNAGTRLFLMQPFRQDGARVVWEEPETNGFGDPGDEEMILDAAFAHIS